MRISPLFVATAALCFPSLCTAQAALGALEDNPQAASAEVIRLSLEDAVNLRPIDDEDDRRRQASRLLFTAGEDSPFLDANPNVWGALGARVWPFSDVGVEAQVSLSQSISLAGAAGLRRDALTAEGHLKVAQADVALLSRRVMTAEAWFALWSAEQTQVLCTAQRLEEEKLLAMVEQLVSAGERSASDVVAAQVLVEQAKLRELTADGDIAHARAVLAEQIGVDPGRLIITEAVIPDVTTSENQRQALTEGIETLPTVVVQQLRARHATVVADEERASRGMRLSVGMQANRESLGGTIVQGTLGIPIPVFDVSAREFASRTSEARDAEADAIAARRKARAQVAYMLHELDHTEEVYRAIVDRLVPIATRALQMREERFGLQEGTLLEVIEARRALFDAKVELVDATSARALAHIEVSLLSQATGNDKS